MALNARIKPRDNINCIIAINGSNNKCQLTPSPPPTQNRKIITQLIKKFTNPDKATEIGKISLGK